MCDPGSCYTKYYYMKHRKGFTGWNKGKTGLAAGWTEARRQHQSRLMAQWRKDYPDCNKTIQYKVGPDPEVQKHYYRFLRSRCQARYWQQEWTISWEDYLDFFKTAWGKWGRNTRKGANPSRDDHLNLTRVDTRQGWHLDNVRLMPRTEAMQRKRHVGPDGFIINRQERNPALRKPRKKQKRKTT